MIRLVMIMVVVSTCAATTANFAAKYGALFEYSNLNKSGSSEVERVNLTDYNEYKRRLINTRFAPVRVTLANLAYPQELRTHAGKTKSEFIAFMTAARINGELTRGTSDDTVNFLKSTQRTDQGGFLLKSTLLEFETTLRTLTVAETNAYLAKLPSGPTPPTGTSGQTVTATVLGNFYIKYMNWGNFTLQDMPLFGPNA